MLNWFRRRRLSAEARRRMMIVAARSEEAIIETHVDNSIELLEALGDEVDLDRGLELYDEMMSLHPALASMVKTRVLSRIDAPGTTRSRSESADDRPRPRRKAR